MCDKQSHPFNSTPRAGRRGCVWKSRAHVSRWDRFRRRAALLPCLQQTLSPFASSARYLLLSMPPLLKIISKPKSYWYIRTRTIPIPFFSQSVGVFFFGFPPPQGNIILFEDQPPPLVGRLCCELPELEARASPSLEGVFGMSGSLGQAGWWGGTAQSGHFLASEPPSNATT